MSEKLADTNYKLLCDIETNKRQKGESKKWLACSRCKTKKPPNMFSFRGAETVARKTTCKDCVRIQVRESRMKQAIKKRENELMSAIVTNIAVLTKAESDAK